MKTATAMGELKEKLQVVVDELAGVRPGTDQYGYRAEMQNVIKDIDAQMFEKEKQQIVDAYEKGHTEGFVDGLHDSTNDSKTGNDYYTQTYNP